MQNKRKNYVLRRYLLLFLMINCISISNLLAFTYQQFGDSTDYPASELYVLNDTNNQPLLVQITKYSEQQIATNKDNVNICLYPSFTKAKDSTLRVNGLVFNVGQDAGIARFSALAESIPMTKSDSLAEIKRFVGTLFNNGDPSKPIISYKGIVQPRYLLLFSPKNNQKNKMAEGSIRAKNKLRERKELVFKKSDATLRLIVLENRIKDNHVLKLVLEGESEFKNSPTAYIQLVGHAGEFSIPLGTFVSDAIHPNYFYLPVEKELVEKLLKGESDYSITFQSTEKYKFSEVKLNNF
ncbi:hypothetical protein [Bernardetia sp.]|uniref:hypothetical protein n=1 Tax=Bernardetia sp. TaxID=1937974 RepID=UPI0025BEBAC1|nr:hypothetical protein [Bernardetia sp.]